MSPSRKAANSLLKICTLAVYSKEKLATSVEECSESAKSSGQVSCNSCVCRTCSAGSEQAVGGRGSPEIKRPVTERSAAEFLDSAFVTRGPYLPLNFGSDIAPRP